VRLLAEYSVLRDELNERSSILEALRRLLLRCISGRAGGSDGLGGGSGGGSGGTNSSSWPWDAASLSPSSGGSFSSPQPPPYSPPIVLLTTAAATNLPPTTSGNSGGMALMTPVKSVSPGGGGDLDSGLSNTTIEVNLES